MNLSFLLARKYLDDPSTTPGWKRGKSRREKAGGSYSRINLIKLFKASKIRWVGSTDFVTVKQIILWVRLNFLLLWNLPRTEGRSPFVLIKKFKSFGTDAQIDRSSVISFRHVSFLHFPQSPLPIPPLLFSLFHEKKNNAITYCGAGELPSLRTCL